MKIVTREEWGAIDQPSTPHQLAIPVKNVVFGYTNSNRCFNLDDCRKKVQDLQLRIIKKDGLPDIRHNFLIDELGNVFVCRGWKIAPRLPKKYISLVGNYRDALYVGFLGTFFDHPPSKEMVIVREQLIKYGVLKGYIKPKFLEFNI